MEKSFANSIPQVTSFFRNPPINKVETEKISTHTIQIESCDQCIQTADKQHAEVQTVGKLVTKKLEYSESALLDFMRTCAPRIELELRKKNKHFGSNFQQFLIYDDEVVTKKTGSLPRFDKFDTEVVYHICWSCCGNKLAVSFTYTNHNSWCKHTSSILIYETDNNDEFTKEGKECIEVNTCVVDMKSHPVMNSVLIFASEEGKIYWHNTTDTLDYNSKNYVHLNGGKITQLCWVELNSSLYVVASDSLGFLYLWNASSNIRDWILWKKLDFKPVGDVNNFGVLSFDFSTLNSQNFVVALEGSILVQCTVNVMMTSGNQICNPVISDFVCPSILINQISFSKFDEKAFAVNCSDKYLRIYHLDEKMPAYVLATHQVALGFSWSHLQDRILFTWSRDGEIVFYDYIQLLKVKSFNLEKEIHSIDIQIKGMKLSIAAADLTNEITVWQTALIIT